MRIYKPESIRSCYFLFTKSTSYRLLRQVGCRCERAHKSAAWVHSRAPESSHCWGIFFQNDAFIFVLCALCWTLAFYRQSPRRSGNISLERGESDSPLTRGTRFRLDNTDCIYAKLTDADVDEAASRADPEKAQRFLSFAITEAHKHLAQVPLSVSFIFPDNFSFD